MKPEGKNKDMTTQISTAIIADLTKTANIIWEDRPSSTQFARAVAYKAHLLGIDIPSEDDFYNMTCCNKAMKDVLHQLGYGVSAYGYGIFKYNSGGRTTPVIGCTNESTWQ